MPEQNYPPPSDDAGALVVPRQLNRWLDKNPQGGSLKRIRKYFTLPVFNIADRWDGYSDIVTAFNFSAAKNFSLKLDYEVPDAPNYVLCISYRVGNVVTRYLLWDAEGSNLNMFIPAYTGQPILKNFRFEVWNTSQGISSSAETIRFSTSILGPYDYMYQQDMVEAVNDTQVLDFWADAVSFNNIVLPDATWNTLAVGVYTYQLGITAGLTYEYSNAPTGHPNARIYVTNDWIAFSPLHNAGDPPFVAISADPQLSWLLIDLINPPPQNEAIVGAAISSFDYTNIFSCPLVFPDNAVSVAN